MTKTELESKHLADLHQLAASAGVERYRMLTRAELIERLSGGDGSGNGDSAAATPSRGGSDGDEERSERPRRRRRRSGSGPGSGSSSGSSSGGREREAHSGEDDEDETPARPPRARRAPRAAVAPAPADTDSDDSEDKDSDGEEEGSRSRRRPRRRRRFGRRQAGISIQDLLLPAESGRQAVLLADSREAATDLLRGVAADLSSDDDGPDPVALLIDPSPEELADWKREAPQAELVSAGQARHATDALATAQRRAADGEDVILLVDSLTRFTDGFGDTDAAKALFDAGRADKKSKGTLTVVVALERS